MLMLLRRLSLTILHLQAGDPGKWKPIQTWRHENQGSQWHKSQPEFQRSKNQGHPCLRAGEDGCPSSSRESKFTSPPSFCQIQALCGLDGAASLVRAKPSFFFFYLMETFFGPQPQNAEVPKPGEFPLWRSGNESDYYPWRCLASLIWVRHCCELWCRSQMQLRSHLAAAMS